MEVSSIAEQLFFTTVRVETSEASGAGVATSFVFNYALEGKDYLFLVTNRHVVSGVKNGSLVFIKGQDGKPLLGEGQRLNISDFEKIWFVHPNNHIDIAIAPLVPIISEIKKLDVEIFYRSIPKSFVPSEEALKHVDAIEEIIFVGYPIGIWDTKNLLPIARKGITATPIAVDFRGDPQFLIDASIFPGSSGSPVFLYNVGMYADKSGGTIVGNRLLFLGVVASVFFQKDISEIRIRSVPTADVPVAVSKQMVDLGVVFKASTIVEAIEAFLRKKGELRN